ncbi:MAG: class I SAM-dependent methyltransferase [Planctomycetia bacterium]|nr:class I SAM-dependent methyltransferase [Planctomycetia bacterium]
MSPATKIAIVVVAAVVALSAIIGIVWRYASRRWPLPCPSWFAFGLENPYIGYFAGSALLLDRLDLAPGMRVLDVGSGPGRLTIPAARRVGPEGQVVAIDMQEGMLRKLMRRAEKNKLTNIKAVHGGIGQGLLEHDAFDRALLVTTLGEIVDREAALREIFAALKPGGVLSVTEVFGDPHYQTRRTVLRLSGAAGFRLDRQFGSWLALTLNLTKPLPPAPAVPATRVRPNAPESP